MQTCRSPISLKRSGSLRRLAGDECRNSNNRASSASASPCLTGIGSMSASRVFIAIRTSQHSLDWLENFSSAVKDIPEIVDVYRMSGEIDYLLRAYVPDIGSYDALYKKLITQIALTDVTSMFAMEELKSTTEVPLIFAERAVAPRN